MTFLTSLRHDQIDAPWFMEGPIERRSTGEYGATVARQESGKPDQRYAPRAREVELDPFRELHTGQRHVTAAAKGRTHVSPRPRSALFERFFLHQRGRPHMSIRYGQRAPQGLSVDLFEELQKLD